MERRISMILVVAEKPSAGRDIARVLGADNKKQGYMEGKNKHISEELISTTHQQHTNMKDMIE